MKYFNDLVTKKNQWIDSHHMVLFGHRSIVNQVRYNPQKCVLASSGVEKVIKIWRPFELEDWTGSLAEDEPTNSRDIFSHEEYVSLLNSSQSMTHDYSHQSTTEDPRMMACECFNAQLDFISFNWQFQC